MCENKKCKKNLKNYNSFLFCTEFSRNLIELYIPLVLYKAGFQIKEIVLYVFFVCLFSMITILIITRFYYKISDRFLVGIGGVNLLLVYIFLKNIHLSIWFLVVLALIYAIYRRCYWTGKRFYTLEAMSREKKTYTGGIIAVISQITKLLASVISGILLDKNQIMILLLCSFVMIIIGVLYLSRINLKEYQKDKKNISFNNDVHKKVGINELKDIMKKLKISDLISLICYEGLFIIDFFLPLYLFIYVKNQFSFVGIVNLIIGISSIIFVLLFSKRIDKSKKDYLKIITLIYSIIILLEINILNPIVIMILSLLNGYCSKFHFVMYVRKLWCLDEDIDKASYNMFLEIALCIGRLMLSIICLLASSNIRFIIYVGVICFLGQAILGYRNDLKL